MFGSNQGPNDDEVEMTDITSVVPQKASPQKYPVMMDSERLSSQGRKASEEVKSQNAMAAEEKKEVPAVEEKGFIERMTGVKLPSFSGMMKAAASMMPSFGSKKEVASISEPTTIGKKAVNSPPKRNSIDKDVFISREEAKKKKAEQEKEKDMLLGLGKMAL